MSEQRKGIKTLLFPYQKQTQTKWWHRLAKIIFIAAIIVTPLSISSRFSTFDSCSFFLDESFGNSGYPIFVQKSDADYDKRTNDFNNCASDIHGWQVIDSILGEATMLIILNILYYRVLLYIIYGKTKE